jgi:arabinogalactan oligomer / maltooligosaccharide transport system permease protein
MATMATPTPTSRRKSKTWNKAYVSPSDRVILWVSRVIIWFVLLVTLLPIWFVVEASFNPSNAYLSFTFFPPNASLDNYRELFTHTDYLLWLKNSLLVGFVVGAIQVLMTALSAFAFSRMRFYGRKYGLMILFLLQLFPTFLSVSAIYGVLARLNMMDSLWSYMLVILGTQAYNIWLLKGYLDALPKELDEAALIDGADSWQRFWRIYLPLSVPMLVVIFLFTLVGLFAEYALAGTILQSPEHYTLAVGLYGMISQQFGKNWGEFAAAALISAVPLAIIFGIGQRYIVSGLAAGSVKG